MNIFIDKSGKAKELSLVGCIVLIVTGILLLSVSSSDSTGALMWVGIAFLAIGLLGLLPIFLKAFR